jgi:hypothetical protein
MPKATASVVAALAAVVLAVLVSTAAARSLTANASSPPVLKLPPASDFVTRIGNPFFPLRRGTTYTYAGQEDGKPRKVVVSVTQQTKRILGIRATVVFDRVIVDGRPEEKTWDWYAQDKRGNVWYLGEDSFDFISGKWKRSDGSWEAGVNGAKPGLVMEAHPAVGDAYRQEYKVGHAEDMAKVISANEAVVVPYGRFKRALRTSEWTPLERGVVEHKFYVRGVGNVRTVMVKGGSEEERLVSVTR